MLNSSPAPAGFGSARNGGTDEPADPISHAGRGKSHQQLPHTGKPDAEPGEQRRARADEKQRDTARHKTGNYRGSARHRKLGRNRKNRADREQQKRCCRGCPRRTAKLIGVDPQLLPNERVESGPFICDKPLCQCFRLVFRKTLGLIDQRELFLLLFRHLLEFVGFGFDLPLVRFRGLC